MFRGMSHHLQGGYVRTLGNSQSKPVKDWLALADVTCLETCRELFKNLMYNILVYSW
jgi:hypothetical protein